MHPDTSLTDSLSRLLHIGALPGHGGSVSRVVPKEEEENALRNMVHDHDVEVAFLHLNEMAKLQDPPGRTFNAHALSPQTTQRSGFRRLGGLTILCNASGYNLSELKRHPERICALSIWQDGSGFTLRRLAPHEVPPNDIGAHLAGHAANLVDGLSNSSVLHCHAQSLIDISSMVSEGDTLARVLLGQRSDALDLTPRLGFVSRAKPGSEAMVLGLAEAFRDHKAIVLQEHGVTLRGLNPESLVDQIENLEAAARSFLTAPRTKEDPTAKLGESPLGGRTLLEPIRVNEKRKPTPPQMMLPEKIRAIVEAEGGCWTADEIRLRYPELLQYLQDDRALTVHLKGVSYFPRWQFVDGQLDHAVCQIREVLRRAGYGNWEQLVFFLTPRISLHDAHPLDAIRGGKINEAVESIESFAEQGAE